MINFKKIILVLVCLILIVISVGFISPMTTKVENHEHTIEIIDKEIGSVLKLTGGSTLASAVISLLPNDTCTPIAEQLAELSTYFLIVLSALYLEKYLLTMFGFITFTILIPLAIVLFAYGKLWDREKAKAVSWKLALTGLALYFLVPLGVKMSETVYKTYETTIESTVATAEQMSVEQSVDAGAVEKFLKWIEGAAVTVTEFATKLLGRFVESIAVMIVAACLIPILAVILFIWLVKVLFKLDFSMSDVEKFLLFNRHRHHRVGEKPDEKSLPELPGDTESLKKE